MPTAILAEDEYILRNELRETLAVLWPELEIIKETSDGVSTLHAVKELCPDIVFLDINMPHLSGLEVSTVIKEKTNIVFITAYTEYAVDAFDVGAIDYLIKPINRGRLLNTIERLKSKLSSHANVPHDIQKYSQGASKSEPKYLRWIQASVGTLLRLITTDEIIFFQSDSKYTRVVTAQTEALIRKPIKDLIEELNPEDFMQVSRSSIVNLRRIDSIHRDEGVMEVRLKGHDERLLVSVGFQANFRQL